ncbi:hypothetical protein [Flavobacterium sp.]|uniref:hypothetical protein n=1 Tax=Flavobacterium sp. TaxID=239 RepID=UPI002617F633|nr:hypothetical protein [Flavobacterium sp.]MDG2430860.1 hypothetical protein [Flavobacterium sp.]
MKPLITLTFFLLSLAMNAQVPCEYSTNVKDSLGIYKETKAYLMSEKNFGDNSSYIFNTLTYDDGLMILNVQLIQKSNIFIKANCFDKNSKLYLQLDNGKIITLLHIDQENCGTLLRDDKGFDNRLTVGTFMFLKGTLEDLKNSPVSLMRIKFSTGLEDFVIKKEIKSEMDGTVYNPENYFINFLKCVE